MMDDLQETPSDTKASSVAASTPHSASQNTGSSTSPLPTMDNRGLSGRRLVGGPYEEMTLTTDAAGGVRGYSPTLGLSLCRRDDDRLRVHDPTDESCALNVAEERAARLAAEAGNRRLRERLRRLRPQD